MPAEKGDKSDDSTIKLIAKKIRSQILLFSLAIALVIVGLIQVSGAEAIWPLAAILAVFLVGALIYAFAEKGKEPAGAMERSAFGVVPDSRGDKLEVEVWVKSVTVGRTKGDFRIGDQVRVCARANRDCYLTLLNLSSDGELTILFPNRYNQNNRIQGEVTCEVPSEGYGFNIVLEEPAGIDHVKAIVTMDPQPLVEAQFGADGSFFHSVAPTATPRAMRVVADRIGSLDQGRWASASTAFEVKSQAAYSK